MTNEAMLRKFKRDRNIKFIIAVIIDLVGYLSYMIPVVAESIDVIWAPLSGILIFILFRKRWKIALGGAFGGVIEEMSLGLDFIPTAILIWTIVYIKDNDNTLILFLEKETAEEELVNNYRRKMIDDK